MTDKRILILRTTDILSTNTNSTYYGQTIRNQNGTISNNRDNMTWNNINMRQLLGSMYDKYERFNISLVSAYIGVAEDAWMASALQPTQAVENIRNLVIKIGGLPFDAPVWSQKKGQTQLAPVGTILLNRLHDSEIIKGCGKPVLQQYPQEANQYTFTKSCDIASINIQLHNVQTDTFPIYELYGAPTAPRLHGHCIFMFSIEGVTFGTPERRVLRLSTTDITTKNNTLDYVAAANGTIEANQYGTIGRNKMTTTWNNINIRATFGDEFYRRYKKYKINLNTCFVTPQDSATDSISIDTRQRAVFPLTNPSLTFTTNSFTPVVSTINTAANTTYDLLANPEISSTLTELQTEMGAGDFPDPYFYPIDGKTRNWKQLVYLNGSSGTTSSYNVLNLQWNLFENGTVVTYKALSILNAPVGYQYTYQVYPISYESPEQMDVFFTMRGSNTQNGDNTTLKLGRCYGNPGLNSSYSLSTGSTPTSATGSWKLWFVDTANQYVAFVNGDSTSANRNVYIYNNYNLTGDPTIINLSGSNNVSLRHLSYEFRKPYAVLAPRDYTSDGKAFLLNYVGSGQITWTITDAFKSTLNGFETQVTTGGSVNASLVKLNSGWNIVYTFPSLTYRAATTRYIEYKYAVWDGVQDSVPFYRFTQGFGYTVGQATPQKQTAKIWNMGISNIEGTNDYIISYFGTRGNSRADNDFDVMRRFNPTQNSRTYVSGGAVGTNTVVLDTTFTFGQPILISGTGLPENTFITAIAGTTFTLSANFTVQATGTYYLGNSIAINTGNWDGGGSGVKSYARSNIFPQCIDFYLRLKVSFTVTDTVIQTFCGTASISDTVVPSENKDLSICLDGLAYSAPTYSTPQFISGSTALMRTITLPNYSNTLCEAGTTGQMNAVFDKPVPYTFQKWNENIPLTINLYDITDANGLATLYGDAYPAYNQYCAKPGDQYYLFDVEGVEEEEI